MYVHVGEELQNIFVSICLSDVNLRKSNYAWKVGKYFGTVV